MESRKSVFIVILAVLVIIGGGVWFAQKSYAKNTALVQPLAQCIKDSGAVFNGAFWCSACGAQKKMFYGAVKDLPYFECSNPDRSMNEACTAKGVKSFPTWEFPDKTVVTGVLSYAALAEKTKCELPPGLE